MSNEVVIVGAGISGLSSAFFLDQAGISVRVIEHGETVGGNLVTSNSGGYQLEHGPNTILQRPGADEDALGRLLEGLGLTPIVANQTASKRFIVRNRRLAPLPASPIEFLTTPAFTGKAKLRLLLEPFIGRATSEESIAQFVERRLGREILDYAIDPFVSGVFAGDVRQLSVRAAVARIHALEEAHGSLIRGALSGRRTNTTGMPQGRMISFDGGVAELPRAIGRALPAGSVQAGTRVERLQKAGHRWQVHWAREDGSTGIEQADRVILATPAHETARILAALSPQAAELLAGISYPPLASIGLGYPKHRVAHPLDGFGFLVPRCEGVRMLGALFSSTLFPDRAPDGHVLLTTFIGGATDPAVGEMDDAALAREVSRSLAGLLGVEGEPDFIRVTRYRKSIPQYNLGHLVRLESIKRMLAGERGLHLRGNWSDGISVTDCVRNGELLAREIVREQGKPSAPG